ncbi:MAG: response regulator [Pseudomonadota bacterium]
MIEKIENVVLIDDEKFDRMHYCRVMERSGLVANVTVFQYAEDALEYLDRPDSPGADVLFLDINMPRMNGFEFLEAAEARFGPEFARIVIIMLTTSLNPDDRVRAAAFAAVQDFINKPLDPNHVAHALGLLNSHRAA